MRLFFSIRNKLTLIYTFLIIIPLVLVNYMSVQNMSTSVFHEVEVNTLKTANIIANLSREHFNDLVELKRIVKRYVPPLEGRILIIDGEKKVLADSFNLLEEANINNQEVRGALIGQEKLGYYENKENILQVAVPIYRIYEGNRSVVGVVLISTSVTNLFEQVKDFRVQLTMISVIAGVIGLFVVIIASSKMAQPISSLSRAAIKISQGELGGTVSIQSKDEIGRLAENFNQMSRELHRIDKGRMQFIGDVSHELKTPLASMKALIDSLLYGENDIEVFKEYLQDMDTEIDRLTGLIKSLLTLTKLEEQGIKLKKVDLEGLVTESIKILRPLIQQSEIGVAADLPEATYIVCDPDRIKEVFINLIDNAIKYLDPKKKQHFVKVYHQINKNNLVLIFEDNGLGMYQKDLESIFEKFYRTDLSRSRDTGGAGIGLSIVKRIVDAHHWEITVESQLDKGTVFKISIPKDSFSHSL